MATAREEPTAETVKASEARAQWATLVNQVARGRKRVLIEKSGIPVAALVSADDLAKLQRLEARRRENFAVIDEIRAAFAGEPDEKIQQEADKAIAEVRAEQRAGGHEAASAS